MALEYVYYSAADLDTESLHSVISSVGGQPAPDDAIVRDGLIVIAYRIDPGEEVTAAERFGFQHRVTVRFRFTSLDPDLEGRNTAVMIGAVLDIVERTAADGVLLFNGEEAVLQVVDGRIFFGADWLDWDDFPEVVEIRARFATASLPQPLL